MHHEKPFAPILYLAVQMQTYCIPILLHEKIVNLLLSLLRTLFICQSKQNYNLLKTFNLGKSLKVVIFEAPYIVAFLSNKNSKLWGFSNKKISSAGNNALFCVHSLLGDGGKFKF